MLLGEWQTLSLLQKKMLEENEVLRAEAHLRTQQLEKALFLFCCVFYASQVIPAENMR